MRVSTGGRQEEKYGEIRVNVLGVVRGADGEQNNGGAHVVQIVDKLNGSKVEVSEGGKVKTSGKIEKK